LRRFSLKSAYHSRSMGTILSCSGSGFWDALADLLHDDDVADLGTRSAVREPDEVAGLRGDLAPLRRGSSGVARLEALAGLTVTVDVRTPLVAHGLLDLHDLVGAGAADHVIYEVCGLHLSAELLHDDLRVREPCGLRQHMVDFAHGAEDRVVVASLTILFIFLAHCFLLVVAQTSDKRPVLFISIDRSIRCYLYTLTLYSTFEPL